MYTQQHRLLKVHSPAFAENTFLLTAFSGEEALSKPFEFELTLISQVVDIKADTLLGQTITIVIDTGINAPRVFNGYMVQVLESPHRASGFSEYTIKVVPWFWYSHLTSGTQRFEGKSVVQIFTEVCRGLGCYDFDTRQLHQSYAPVAVVVQYNETVLDFLSRILCEARIDYRFTHTQQTHTLVLIDSVCERLTSPIDWLRSDDKRQWCRTKRWATPQREAFSTSAVSSSPLSIPTETRIQGISQSPVLTPGYRVSLADAPSDDDEMVIVSVTHQARDNSVLTGQAVELSAVYSNTVCGTLALSKHQATTVTAPGSDVAMIVGHHDKHIDADTHGRVKSHFYWQTEDHPSSRQRLEVLQPIAGADWGMQFLPRQGDEALVRYIQGDPKQPIVLGSVYNGINLPFYPLPAAQTTTGIVTCRVGGEAMGSSHRLTFDDSHGQERFTLVSSGDFTIQSRQHLTQTIDATQHHHIKGKMTAITEGTQTIDSHRALRLITPSGNGIVMHDHHIILQGATIQLGQPGEGQRPLMHNPSLCQLHQFVLSGNRLNGHQFQFDLLNDKPTTTKSSYLIQVIASDKSPERIKIQFSGDCRRCPIHKTSQPMFLFTGPNIDKSYTHSTVIEVYGPGNKTITHDFVGFFNDILIPNHRGNVYTVKPQLCDEKVHPVTIEAYAPVEWHGKVSVGYQHQPHQDSHFNQQQGWKKLKVHGEWNLDGSLSVKRNQTTWSLGDSRKTPGGHYKNHQLDAVLFKGIQGFLNHILPFFGSIKSNYASVDIQWPKLSIGGHMKNVEVANTYDVSTEGEIELAFTPFLGAKANLNILNWFITVVGGPFGAFIVRVKEKLAAGVGNEKVNVEAQLQLVLSLGAELAGNFTWNRALGCQWQAEGQLENRLPISITGKVAGELRVFIVKIAAGVVAKAESSVSVNLKADIDSGKPVFYPQFSFNGLTVYWAVYHEVQVGTKTHHGPKSTVPPGEGRKENSMETRFDHSQVLLEPKVWPEQPLKICLDGGGEQL